MREAQCAELACKVADTEDALGRVTRDFARLEEQNAKLQGDIREVSGAGGHQRWVG